VSTVTVQLFASYAECFGTNALEIPITPGTSVNDLIRQIRALPGSEIVRDSARVAINRQFARPDQLVGPGDEVALIPPVAGG
jgi:molybdopterin converting factor small subunit